MAIEVVMPRLGWTMEVGTVVEWLRKDGERVEAGDMIFSVESDKAVVEVEAIDSGLLRIPADTPVGVEVPVGHRLAYILAPGDSEPALVEGLPLTPVSALIASPDGPRSQSNSIPSNGAENSHATVVISPRARRTAQQHGVDWTTLAGSGSTGRIRERDIFAAIAGAAGTNTPRATPSVRRLAEESGVQLETVAASGLPGRVTRADVLAASQPTAAAAPRSTAATNAIRKVIATRMSEAAHIVAPVTLTTECDATELVRLRSRMKDESAQTGFPVPSLTDMLVKLTAIAIKEHPAINSSYRDDSLTVFDDVHIGLAADTERGLMAPVIRNADLKSLGQITIETVNLLQRARDGTATSDELRGSTFTISNLGMFSIDAFTPIINLPEAAILGIGRIVAKPVVIDEETEQIAVRKMVVLSLTFDHRAIDGAPAARFLQRVGQLVANPYGALTL